MGLLDWFRKSGPEPVGGYDQLVELFSGVAARSGVAVNARTALECSAVLACVRVIANGLAQVPFKLYRAEGRNRNPAVGHGLYELMDMAPNEFQTAFEFRHMLALHLCLTGNAYIWLNRVGGRIVEMLPYPPGCVSIERDGWELTYRITTQDKRYITVPRKDMWHVRWLSWDGVSGLDGVVLAREVIGLSLALETHGASSFRNGVRPSGILSTDQGLNKDQRKDLRTAWEAAFAGTENAGRAAVLGSGMKWTQLSMPNDAAQFIESRQYQVEEVCRAFGVLPIMVGRSDKASTYASAEQMFLQHAVHTLGPWYACLEKSASRWLLSEAERRDGYYFKFNVNGLMRGAAKDRAEFYTRLYGVGALSPNDIRELEDINPYVGGDEYRVPLNMAEPGRNPMEGDEDGKA